MLTKHTPGPWRRRTTGNIGNSVEAFCGKTGEYDDGWRTVATLQNCEPTGLYAAERENAEANGNLIAAAPELFRVALDLDEVLTELGMHCECGEPDCRTTRMRAAIAKAQGATNAD